MRDRRSFTLNGIKSQSLRFKRDATEIVKEVLKSPNDVLGKEHGRHYF